MSDLHDTLSGLDFAQICWVVPDIAATVRFLSGPLGIAGFPEPERVRAQDLGMTYHGRVEDAEWLTTQAYNGNAFLELVQPISGRSMFRDFLDRHPEGGTQHVAFRLPVEDSGRVLGVLRDEGYAVVGEVDHPIAHMTFFDTTRTLGVVTEIMGITPDGWAAVEKMQNAR